MNWLSTVIIVVWISVSAVIPFVIGGLALFSPIPILSEWLKSVRLYDAITTVGYAYAVLMSLAAVSLGLYRESVSEPVARREKLIPRKLELVIASLGGIILFTLIADITTKIVS